VRFDVVVLCGAGLVAAGCGSGSDPIIEMAENCNPLGEAECLTPFPAAIYMIEDATTATGWRLDLAEGALPTNVDDRAIDPAMLARHDGFSPAAPILVAFPTGVDPSNLLDPSEYQRSLGDDSPTILIDMDRGERVAHFAEVDPGAADTPAEQALYIRPAQRLQPATRYAVGIRTTLRAPGGGPLPVPEGYQAILDGTVTEHQRLERIRGRYPDIFAAFATEGLAPEDLVVAWDFVTASDEFLMSDVLTARDAALDAMGEAGANLSFTIEEDTAHDDPDIRRRIEGTFSAPLFLTQDGRFNPGTELARDSAGRPALQGLYESPFVAIVPECAYTDGPVPMVVYGHGLMGTAGEVAGGAVRTMAAAVCVVVVGTDMRGMSTPDLPNVFLALNDLNNAPWIFSALVQGVINHIALEHAARGPMAADLFVDDQGDSLVDPTRVYFYGLSQGHIFGSTFVAYDPFITRGVVGVGGANYSMMLERSSDWPTYESTLTGSYLGPLQVTIAIHLMQMFWDFTDPATTSPYVAREGVPGAGPKQLLLHMGTGDPEVPNIATEWQARTMGAGVLTPSIYEPWGLEPVASGTTGSALVIYDGGARPPLAMEPPSDNDAHYLTRSVPATFRQMATFYETGAIEVACRDEGDQPAACDCTAGNCD
jgi:hypothetical protein